MNSEKLNDEQTNVFGIDAIISGGATHLHQNTLQCVEEEVFLQINNLNEFSSIFLGGTSIFQKQEGGYKFTKHTNFGKLDLILSWHISACKLFFTAAF